MNKAKELQKIADQIVADNVCPHLAESATNLVPGEGSADAQVMFVGEAPGAKEDISGKPFVGAAGKFLNEMLATINLQREDVFITSIVKYRPPGNRDPKQEEREAFTPYLLKQIEVIKPKLVVLLGRHAMSVFLPELAIGTAHGQIQRKDNKVFLPLYHPAAALYNGSLRQTLVEDFSKIPKILKQLNNK